MKQLNKFIIEKLKLNSESKLINYNQTLEELRNIIGFGANEYNENPYSIIKEWVNHYNINQLELVTNYTTFNEFLLEPNKPLSIISITIMDDSELKKLFKKDALNECFNGKGIHIYTNNKKPKKCLILSFEENVDPYIVLIYNRNLSNSY